MNRGRRRCLLAAAILAATPGCDGGDDGTTATTTTQPTTTTTGATSSITEVPTTTTTTTQPDATDLEAVRPYILDLLARRDELATLLAAEPERIRDPDDTSVAEFGALFTPGNEYFADVLVQIAEIAGSGVSYRATEDGAYELSALTDLYSLGTPDAVGIDLCVYSDAEAVAADGTRERETFRVNTSATAVLRDGVWLLADFLPGDEVDFQALPVGAPNPCALEAADE